MSAPVLQTIENELWQVGVLPSTGASTAFARIRLGRQWVDLLRPTPQDRFSKVDDCASYVLVPWSNRIRNGVFRFRGTEYRLRQNFPDQTAIHGTARDFSWSIAHADANRIVLRFDSREPGVAANFPFPFTSEIEFRVEQSAFVTSTKLRNVSAVPFCAGFGHHPYFRRSLTQSCDDEVQAEIPCSQYYVAERCLPSGAAVPAEPRVDFRKQRPLGTAFVDDCLTGRPSGAPIRLSYPRSGVNVEMSMDDLYSHVVVYIPVGQTFFAVEPVTNANDGFNLYDKGVPGTGVFVLDAGREVQATYTLKLIGH